MNKFKEITRTSLEELDYHQDYYQGPIDINPINHKS